MATDITVDNLTSNVVTSVDGKYKVTGDGVLDKLMETLNTHIEAQYNLNRIKGTDYANVYLGMMQTAIAQAVQFLLQEQGAEQDVKVKEAQEALIQRQTKGFDDDAKQKLLKQSLDSWSVAYSVAQDANSIPDTIKVNVIDSVMKDAMDSLTIVKSNDPLGEA